MRLDGYDQSAKGDIYFFAVQPNPADNGSSLIALFPLAHRLRGCVALSASLDGVRWSRPMPLLSCGRQGPTQRSDPHCTEC